MTSRRQNLLDASLEAFIRSGYEGTPVSAIVGAAGMSKAAFTYHFGTKERLLLELVTPMLDALDRVVYETHDVDTPEGVRDLLGRYLDALIAHRRVAMWVDGDNSVLHHSEVGGRLTVNNEKMRGFIAGSRREADHVAAAAVLGALWRPIRNLSDTDLEAHRNELLNTAVAATERAQ